MTQALETLLPCPAPWCAKSDPVLAQGGFRNQSYRVQCETCGCATPRFYEPAKAKAAWNTRKPCDAGLREALTDARDAIASLDEYAFGGVAVEDPRNGEPLYEYPTRDELLAKIDAALSKGDATR